jgi:hypothetical protein
MLRGDAIKKSEDQLAYSKIDAKPLTPALSPLGGKRKNTECDSRVQPAMFARDENNSFESLELLITYYSDRCLLLFKSETD